MQPSELMLNNLLAQISGGNAEATIRIQMGRTVVYKGTATKALTDQLSPAQLQELNAALATPVGQPAPLSAALNISRDRELIYRCSAKAGVTLNQIAALENELTKKQAAIIEMVEEHQLESKGEFEFKPESEVKLERIVELEAEEPAAVTELAPEPLPSEVEAAALEPPTPLVDMQPQGAVVPGQRSTLSGSEVLMLELHEAGVTTDQTRQWLYDQLPTMAQSGLVQTLQTEGAQWTRNALKQASELTESAAQKAVADSIVALTKRFGQLQKTADGKRFIYQAENYSVTVRGTNHYTLVDSQGKTLFAFRHSPTQIQTTVSCQLRLSQRLEMMQAGASLQITQAKQAMQTGAEAFSAAAIALADMAPAGTFERLV